MFVCGTSYGREGVPVDTLAVSNARIQFSSAVKLLGVHLESDLSLEKQLSSMVKACVFCGVFVCLFVLPHLRVLSTVRSLLTREAANAIEVCLILSKSDYCDSLLGGLPQTQIKTLPAVQNAAVRVVVR